MPFRPNYRQARGERVRAKEQKKQEKLRKREEDTARRKTGHESDENGDGAAPVDGAVVAGSASEGEDRDQE